MEDGLKENKDGGQKKDLKEVSVTFEKRSYLQGFQKVDSLRLAVGLPRWC